MYTALSLKIDVKSLTSATVAVNSPSLFYLDVIVVASGSLAITALFFSNLIVNVLESVFLFDTLMIIIGLSNGTFNKLMESSILTLDPEPDFFKAVPVPV